MQNQRTGVRIGFFPGMAGLMLAAGGVAIAASPMQLTASTRFSPARPLVSSSASEGVARLKLVPNAFQDLKSGPADRLVAIPRGDGEDFELELRRFTVTIPNTQFISAGTSGQSNIAPPDVVSFRGEIAGKPGSHAFLSVTSGGSVNGYVTQPNGQRYFLAAPNSNVAASGEVIIAPESASPGIFEDTVSCGVTHAHDFRISSSPAIARGGNAGLSPRVLYVAIDADQRFYQLFNDETAAQAYIVQVIAAVSDIYIRDFDAKLVLTFSRVWPNGGEPFGAHDLAGFADYWFINEDPTPYHLIHLMSGRRDTSYGGVAYVAGSCSGSAFGISAFLLGRFPTPIGNPNLNTWDVVVVAHEMGHNMGTFHTHDGYSPPIDNCANGVWARGEIMSYCHTMAGGLLNTEMRFTSRVQEVVRGDLEFNDCQFYDCNDNGLNDVLDVFEETSADTNSNQVPDECEDCNTNGTLDPTDITLGAPDVNSNGVPDACEADCNANGRPDTYDISDFSVADVNLNLVPDSCEPDCDNDSIADFFEIANSAGTLDFDRNGLPDACQDCNSNGASDWVDLLRPGNIYVADLSDFVREFHAASGAAIGTLAQGSLLDPYDVTFGPDRLLYIADRGNNRIVRLNPDSGGPPSVFGATAGGTLSGPSGLTFGPNGNLFVSSIGSSRVVEYHGQTGAFVRNFVIAGAGGISSPYGLEFAPNGNLLVADGNRVNEYNGATGVFIRNFVAPGAGGLSDPRGIAILPDGRLLVVNRSSNQILAYDSNGASLGQFNDEYPLGGLWGIRVGPNGNVFVVRVLGNVRIIEYDVNTGRYLRSFIRGDAQLSQPTGLAFRSESPVDCNGNSALDVCDIADGVEEDVNGNSIPDACETECAVALPLLAAPDGVAKNRYLSFDTTSAQSGLRAIQVTLADLPAPFESFEGQSRWVGPPQDRPDTESSTFKAATLLCDPFYSDWSGVGVLAVFDVAVVPGGTYELRAISDSCDAQQQSSYSSPLAVTTVPRWGDAVAPFSPPSATTQPDFGDVAALVDKFRNAPGAPAMAQADLHPSLPDQVLDFSDIALVVDAFRGMAYPFPGPTLCP